MGSPSSTMECPRHGKGSRLGKVKAVSGRSNRYRRPRRRIDENAQTQSRQAEDEGHRLTRRGELSWKSP